MQHFTDVLYTSEPPKKAFSTLSKIFAISALIFGILGLIAKALEVILAFPAFIVLGLLMMTYLGIILGILIWIPVVNVIAVIIIDIFFILMNVCAISAELLPFMLAILSIIMACEYKAQCTAGHSDSARSVDRNITLSVVTMAISVIPAILWIIIKTVLNAGGITVFTQMLFQVLSGAALG